jgi:hypothetical protein
MTPSPTITPSPTPIPETSANRDATPQRDERWYAMTLGLIVSVVIITAGNLFNMLRNLPRRGENS